MVLKCGVAGDKLSRAFASASATTLGLVAIGNGLLGIWHFVRTRYQSMADSSSSASSSIPESANRGKVIAHVGHLGG